MNIFLMGFMGCGKSTIGKKLANKLGFSFMDLDNAIEQGEKQTITQIFNTEGEQHFRMLEQDYLKNIKMDNVVVSLGGGTACNSDNLRFIRENSISVYLQLSKEMLLSRLIDGKHKRPLIADLNNEELKLFIDKKLDERAFFYNQAHIVFSASSLAASDIEALANTVANYSK